MTTRFTREQAIFLLIMSFVCSYGYIEPFFFFFFFCLFVLMEVISVSNDWIWLIDVIK